MHDDHAVPVLDRIRSDGLHELRGPGDAHVQDIRLGFHGVHVPQGGGVGAGEHRMHRGPDLPRTHYQVPQRPPSAWGRSGRSVCLVRYPATNVTTRLTAPTTTASIAPTSTAGRI